ncbi:MAG: hypothetical protein IJP99_10640 [Methanobrevibacter sp.]|nr:hypothetical protein [Methanobrevibacter sp.]MBR0059775.1 hypothetical protein [Methanobrevibacter sp.]
MIDEMINRKNEGYCPFCGVKVSEEDFTDEISRKEFTISGLCQRCQDDFFE